MADARDTLVLAFDRQIATPPSQAERWLFLNARPLPPGHGDLAPFLDCEQGFRPDFVQLREAGYAVEPRREDLRDMSGAMVLLTRSRALNEQMLARAWEAVREGGVILVGGANTDGAKSLRKWAAKWAGVEDSLAKHHAGVFSVRRDGRDQPFHLPPPPRRGVHAVAPGMFSADGPDAGSQMLANHFDERIAGRVADFGAGWGYLGTRLLEQCPQVSHLESVEADHASLEAAKANLSVPGEGRSLGFRWCDLTREEAGSGHDWVVMNPPFHAGRAAQPEIGAAFIAAAGRALKPGGRLLMVANRQLPYEQAVAEHFSSARTLEEDRQFKVIEAVR